VGSAIDRVQRWLEFSKQSTERYDRDDAKAATYAMDVLSKAARTSRSGPSSRARDDALRRTT